MTSLRKSTPVSGDPLVLSRPKRWDSEPVRTIEAAPIAAAIDVASVSRNAIAPDMEAAAPPAPIDHTSYEEYRERFEVELSALERQARREGFEKGESEGREQASAEYATHIDALANVVAAARAALDQTIEGVAEMSVEIVSEAVTKIIGEAAIDRDVIVSVIRQVVREAKDRSKLIVHVSPQDWALLEGVHDRLVEGLSVGSVDIVADDRVQLGGCLLETPSGNLDGRLEIQLARLRDALVAAKSALPVDTEVAA